MLGGTWFASLRTCAPDVLRFWVGFEGGSDCWCNLGYQTLSFTVILEGGVRVGWMCAGGSLPNRTRLLHAWYVVCTAPHVCCGRRANLVRVQRDVGVFLQSWFPNIAFHGDFGRGG